MFLGLNPFFSYVNRPVATVLPLKFKKIYTLRLESTEAQCGMLFPAFSVEIAMPCTRTLSQLLWTAIFILHASG